MQTDKFFDYLKANGYNVNAYFIMPDHVPAKLRFTYTEKWINRILGDGKDSSLMTLLKNYRRITEKIFY